MNITRVINTFFCRYTPEVSSQKSQKSRSSHRRLVVRVPADPRLVSLGLVRLVVMDWRISGQLERLAAFGAMLDNLLEAGIPRSIAAKAAFHNARKAAR